MQHPRWRSGKLSTAFIAEEFPKGFERARPIGAVARTIAGVAAAIDHVLGERKRRISGQLNSAVTRERRRAIWLGDEDLHADVAHDGSAVDRRVRRRQQPRPLLVLDSRRAGLVRHDRWRPGRRACADDPERLRARLSRHRGEGLRLHRARGALCAADAGEEALRQRKVGALPDAGPGGLDGGGRRPGGQGRRDAWRWSRR